MDAYEKLRELLDAHPSGAPPSKAFAEILPTNQEMGMRVLQENGKLERFPGQMKR